MSDAEAHSGGCQCGAVRYRFTDIPGTAHVCHCRMCQKAVGGFYAAWIEAVRDSFEVTRGELPYFQSLDEGQRGFCAACGTPLVFAHTGGEWLAVTIGSLDRPDLFPPVDQHGVEGRHGFVNGIGTLPDRPATDVKEPETAAQIRASNRQHPDHDTEIWPLEGGAHG